MSTQSTPNGDFAYLLSTQGASNGGFAQSDPSGGNPYVDPRYSTKNDHQLLVGTGDRTNDLFSDSTGSYDPASPNASGPRTQAEELQRILIGSINNPDSVLGLQKELIKAGVLNPKSRTFVPGDIQPGDATYYSLTTLMAKAEDAGVDYRKLISDGVDKNIGAKNFDYFMRKFGADGTGTTDIPYHQSQTILSNPLDAMSILNNTFQTFQGRNANPTEIAAFTAALHQAQQQNPTVTDGSYDPALGYRGDRNSTTTEGLTGQAVQQFAENYATTGQEQKGANEYSLNNYVNLFEQMLKGGG